MRTCNIILNKFPFWIAIPLLVLDFLWELPQNILGLIMKLVFHKYSGIYLTNKEERYYINFWSIKGGISLGWFQFINIDQYSYRLVALHEVGHSKQSLYLGPLYLLVVGIPSILWAGVFHRFFFKNKSYYSFYTEAWANSLMENSFKY